MAYIQDRQQKSKKCEGEILRISQDIKISVKFFFNVRIRDIRKLERIDSPQNKVILKCLFNINIYFRIYETDCTISVACV
jgi:hypothetical protein